MEKITAEINRMVQNCCCGNHHNSISIERISVGNRALKEAVLFLGEKSFKHAVLVADENTYRAAGERLALKLEKADIRFSTCMIEHDENRNVVADERSLVQLFLETPFETDVIIAVGSGTIHDIARFCSYKLRIPFISVPTSPSVDGFASMGAPLIIRGVKKTIQTASPIALFADLAVLKQAPRELIAAGFGDMMAKFTSLADWRFGSLIAGEPYCPLADQLTREALDSCLAHVDAIAEGSMTGVHILIEALIKSGLAMLLFGKSHPASGGEHHLSHYWEMEFLREDRPQVLHGAKTGVSTPIIADFYKKQLLIPLMENLNGDSLILKKVIEHKQAVIEILNLIPDSTYLRRLIKKAGGVTEPTELGISDNLVISSLKEAHYLRDRYTFLKFINDEMKVEHSMTDAN
jgi:glycerol-1-phosphate dehydrogenase [NAD(P)+]